MTDRKIEVPRRERRARHVEGFDVEPGAPLEEAGPSESPAPTADVQPSVESRTRPEAARPTKKKPGAKRPQRETTKQMPTRKLKVFATIGQDLATVLPDYAKENDLTQTEVLLTAVLKHAAELEGEYDKEEAERWSALGLRQPARKRPTGRMQKQFYLTEQELTVIDDGVAASGYESRSAYIDELLRREMQFGEPTVANIG